MQKVVIISDVHGCWYTLTRLLNRCPQGAKLVFGGDLIDRGPHSRKVVEFAMENKIPTVAANHDDMCLAFYRRKARCAEYYGRDAWLDNGGFEAVRNWKTIDKRGRAGWEAARDESVGGCIPNEVLDWMEGLPAYLTPSDELDSAGRKLLVSHTGYALDEDRRGAAGWFRALWGRRSCDDGPWVGCDCKGNEIDDGYFRVYGHTPTKTPYITDSEANIDTGAAYSKRGYGNLTAFVWPTKEVIAEPYNEAPITPSWRLADGVLI